ncbi:MAG: hypothetical protein FWG98_11985 [Candidatus Cloacimonetes bacterium]|nr:hypothetical protein [Candidatus Cloacimonadota bacterium]
MWIVARRLLRGRFIEGTSQRRDEDSDTEIASGGDSLKGSRNDWMRIVTRRLLRGEIH